MYCIFIYIFCIVLYMHISVYVLYCTPCIVLYMHCSVHVLYCIYILFCHIVSCRALSFRFVSFRIVSYRIVSYTPIRICITIYSYCKIFSSRRNYVFVFHFSLVCRIVSDYGALTLYLLEWTKYTDNSLYTFV